jgi:predicted AlkP superfamily phosphohydrolase/phosphomutase
MKRVLLFAVIAVVIVGIATLYFVSREKRGSSTGDFTGMISTGRSFDTWADYFTAGLDRSSSPQKVVFIGIDGACWNIIDPLIDEGLLPTFKRLKAEGAYGILRSVEAYVSPPAWATMMTGFLPEHTGVFTFGFWDDERREFVNITSEDIKVPSVWDATSFVGKRTAVVNVPVTYPVREVDGIMVSGLLTPASLDERKIKRITFSPVSSAAQGPELPASFSPVRVASFEYTTTRFDLFLVDKKNDGNVDYDAVILRINYPGPDGRQRRDAYDTEFKVGQYSHWVPVHRNQGGESQSGWCKILVFPTRERGVYGVGRSRVFFDAGDTDVVFTYPDSLQGVLKKTFGHYFPSKFLERGVVPSFAEDSAEYASFLYGYDDWDVFFYVFTQTDNIQHLDGVTPVTKQVYRILDRFLHNLINTLPKNTTLILASDHGFKSYKYSIDLNKLLERLGLLAYKNDKEIDYDKTLVFHNLWHLYFNDDLLTPGELEERGIEVPSGVSPREALTTYLQRAQPSLRVSSDEQLVSIELSPFPENDFDTAPDMIVKGTYSNYMVEFWNLTRPRESILRVLRPDETWNHTREGMYLFFGNGVKRGFSGPVEDIQDIAPTILYLLDLPLAENMDGRVIHSVFDLRQLAKQTYDVVRAYNQIYAQATTDEEREALEKKLRSLGYIR